MAQPIRIECRFCNHGFRVDADRAGERIKCPKCQNPLVVPVASDEEDQEAPARPEMAGRAESKDVSRRPVPPRHQGGGLVKLVKLAVVLAIAVGGYLVYQKIAAQSEKSVVELMAEFAAAETDEATRQLNRGLILKKAGPEDLAVGERYAKHDRADVRALAAAVLGATKKKEAHKALAPLATEDPEVDVRRAAASALGEIRIKESVETLIRVLAREDEDDQVKGDAMGALRKLTAVNTTKPAAWVEWWDGAKASFQVKDAVK